MPRQARIISNTEIYHIMAREEMQSEIINLYKSIYSKSKYEIENIVDSGNGYLVDVSIYLINIISLAYNDILLYIDEFNVKTFNGDFDNLNDEEFENEYVKGITKVMKRYLPEIGYNEKEIITIEVLITKVEFTQLMMMKFQR